MTKQLKNNFKRYAISFAITFASAFFSILSISVLELGSVEQITTQLVLSLILASVRSALKLALESLKITPEK